MKIVYQGKTKTGKDIIIRYPQLGDEAELLNFINKLSDEKTFITYQGEHETLESEAKFLNSWLERIENKKSVVLLVFHGSLLIANALIGLQDKTRKHVGLLAISVAKDFRGDGIGKLLMDLLIKEAKKELFGLKIVTLEVYSTNSIAQSLYHKIGFVQYGALPKGISRLGTFEDAILMYKNIK
jgi:ribosomal protein S18 acetylase RimI-like enzyme